MDAYSRQENEEEPQRRQKSKNKASASREFRLCNVKVTNEFTCKVPKVPSAKKYIKKAVKPEVSKKANMKPIDIGADADGAIKMIDTFDRPPTASADSTYTRNGTYSEGMENKPGKRIPKIGAYAEAGVAEAQAACSVFEAEAKALYAGAGVELSAVGFSANATAGLGTASASAGPIGAKVGLSLDTGLNAGISGIGAHVLGIGFNIGPTTSVSILGNELSFSFI